MVCLISPANRKWRTVPWRKIAQKEHNKARTPAEAEKRQSRLVSKEDAKRKKLAELGIDYEFTGYVRVAATLLVQCFHPNSGTEGTTGTEGQAHCVRGLSALKLHTCCLLKL